MGRFFYFPLVGGFSASIFVGQAPGEIDCAGDLRPTLRYF